MNVPDEQEKYFIIAQSLYACLLNIWSDKMRSTYTALLHTRVVMWRKSTYITELQAEPTAFCIANHGCSDLDIG